MLKILSKLFIFIIFLKFSPLYSPGSNSYLVDTLIFVWRINSLKAFLKPFAIIPPDKSILLLLKLSLFVSSIIPSLNNNTPNTFGDSISTPKKTVNGEDLHVALLDKTYTNTSPYLGLGANPAYSYGAGQPTSVYPTINPSPVARDTPNFQDMNGSIFYFCAEIQSLTICCKTAPLAFTKSGTFKNVGIKANPIWSSGCHWTIEPPNPNQP